jgi:1-acyl-sn-glycerol-3-phosphate acyltransferase
MAIGVGARAMFGMDIVRHTMLPPGPKIIAPNHPSTTDPFLVLLLAEEQIAILIDDRLFKVPLFGSCLRLAGHVPVVPGEGRLAYEAAARLLASGGTVAIYPEGSVSPLSGGFHRPRTGAARLALCTGAPIIPVGIYLERERIRVIDTQIEGQTAIGRWYLDGPYAITVGEPMWFQGDVQDRARVRSISDQVMQRITCLAQESASRVEQSQASVDRFPEWLRLNETG